MRIVLSIVCLIGSAAGAVGAGIDFDRGGFGARRLLEAAREAPVERVQGAAAAPKLLEVTSDCVRFTFEPQDTQSDPVWLKSDEYREDCYGQPPGGGRCDRRWIGSYQRRVTLKMDGARTPFPWEKEIFDVCLQGPRLSFYDVRPAFDYSVRGEGWRDTVIFMKPGAKLAMRPDPEGLALKGFDSVGGSLTAVFADQWASHYGAGEKTVLRLTLKRVGIIFPHTLLDREFVLDPAAEYAVDFSKLASEISEQLQEGKRYYIKWKFQRRGKVSTDDWMPRPSSAETSYKK